MLRVVIAALALTLGSAQASQGPNLDLDRIRSSSAWQAGQEAARNSLSNIRSRPVSGIADEKMEGNWKKLRSALGLSNENQLYVFVSFSMPEPLIRAYALDAAFAGATLVIRGIDEDADLRSFVGGRLLELLRPGEIGAPIQIDPRLFDTYGIDKVPAVVLADQVDNIVCESGTNSSSFYRQQEVRYPKCDPAPPDSFWALSGAVTTQYALETFEGNGSTQATAFLDNLRSGYATEQPFGMDEQGNTIPQVRKGIEGDDFKAQLEVLAARNAQIIEDRYMESNMTIYSTPWGPTQGPAGLDMPIWGADDE